MKILRQRLVKKPGLPPGTLVHVGNKKTDTVHMRLCEYTAEHFTETTITNPADVTINTDPNTVTWFNIDGLHDTALIQHICETFGIHPLVQEDIVNTRQRPKVEAYDEFIYVVVKAYTVDTTQHEVHPEHVSLILGNNFVLSFQEKPENVFQPVLKRLASAKGHIRKMRADYLLYALLDSVVDHYFLVLESFSDRIEDLQDNLLTNPSEQLLGKIHATRRPLLQTLRNIFPVREILSRLPKLDFHGISNDANIYFRDVHDHAFQIIDSLESQRDTVAGMIEMYRSSMSHKMNEVMKTLTIIATIFMPLTFIVGVYGMNFKFMPELEFKWGYPFVWGILIGIGISLFVFFKRKKWF